MDASSLQELMFRYRWILLASAFGILLIGSGIVISTKQLPFGQDKVEFLSAQDTQASSSGQLVVEASGAIQKPGVYKLAVNSRVEELLIAAGGLSGQADREWVEKNINRAAKLIDGQKLFIPSKGSRGIENTTGQITGATINVLVNINAASQSQLEELAGIGPVTAKQIIEHRPYSGVKELLTRKIIKKNQYETIKDQISVY